MTRSEHSRHGLTLLEVLASTALLSIIAATCLPVLQLGTKSVSHPETRSIERLGQLADQILHDPSAFGLTSINAVLSSDLVTTSLAPSEDPAVQVRIAHQVPEEHVWLVFSWADEDSSVNVVRWTPLEQADSEDTP